MNHIEHLEKTRRTWKYLTLEENMKHALLGVGSEVGELMSAYKKSVFKEALVDIVNCVEELGDGIYFCARIVDELNLDRDCLVPANDLLTGGFYKLNDIDITFELQDLSYGLKNAVMEFFDEDCDEEDRNDIKIEIAHLILSITTLYTALLKRYNCSIELCRDINIQKLMIRWPEKFDATQDNKDRNLVAEYEDMKARLVG